MSEERFDRLENQLTQVIQAIGTMQQNMATKQDLAAVEQKVSAMQNNIDAVREDVIALRHRIDSVEGSQNVIIREGFQSLMSYNDDLNYEISDTARQTRLLKRRVIRLERKDKED
jgi:FtsZ-binding cell division protein ZapB